jgi:hypothetical protein
MQNEQFFSTYCSVFGYRKETLENSISGHADGMQFPVTANTCILFNTYLGGTIVGVINNFVLVFKATNNSPVNVEECDKGFTIHMQSCFF